MNFAQNELPCEREAPLHFAGRVDELASLHGRLRGLVTSRDSSGGMVLITGVPGAGKTQLGRRFVQQAAESDARVRSLFIAPEMLTDEVGLFLTIGMVMSCEAPFREIAELDTRRTGAGASAEFLKGNVAWEHGRHTGNFATMLLRTMHSQAWQEQALILVVDEVQGIKAEAMPVLRVLTKACRDARFCSFGIGLQHAEDMLSAPPGGEPGISRVTEPITLGCLTAGEALEAVAIGLEKLGHDVPEAGARVLAERTFGFPQHIHCYLAAAHGALDRHRAPLAGTVLDEALTEGDRARRSFYERRISRVADDVDALLPIVQAMRSSGRRN